MANAFNGGQALGELLFGELGTPGAYEKQLGLIYDTQAKGHDVEYARSRAAKERSQAIIDAVRSDHFQRLPGMGAELGRTPAEMAVIAAGGGNAQQLASALGAFQEQGFRGGAADAALGGDYDAANAHLFGLADGPLKVNEVSDGIATNPYKTEAPLYVTPLGEATINQRNAAAASSRASAQSALGRLDIAREQFGLQRAGQWNPDGSTAGDGMVIQNPDGTTTIIPNVKTTEGERKAAGYYQRMVAAEQELQQLRDGGYRPESELLDFFTAGEGPLRNRLASDTGQVNRQQQEDWVRAKLRLESGAVIADEEMNREIQTYFPQPGDSQAVIESKARSRQQALEQLLLTSGRAAQLVSGQNAALPPLGEVEAPAVTRATNPATGEVIELRNGQWVPVQ